MITCKTCDRQYVMDKPFEDGICMHCKHPLVRVNNITLKAPEGDFGWIQWKGTNVCMDVHCRQCERDYQWFGHIDAEFAYYIKCRCGTIYAVDGHVKLVPLTKEEEPYAYPSVVEVEVDDDC